MNKVVLEINDKRHITKPYSVCSKCSIRKLCNQEGITNCLGYVLTKGDVCHFEVEKELNALLLRGNYTSPKQISQKSRQLKPIQDFTLRTDKSSTYCLKRCQNQSFCVQ